MSITLTLAAETERRLKEKAAQMGQSLEDFLRTLAEQAASEGNGTARDSHDLSSPAQWSREWRAWAASHRTMPTVADDSRDSIYAGRGE